MSASARERRYPVLLHGFSGSAQSWDDRLVDGLSAAGLSPVRLDLPGHGSDAGTRDSSAFTLDATLARVDAAGAWPTDLIGYSLGGRVALHFALARPESVRRLVLESASPGLETEAERAQRREADAALADRILADGIDWFVDHWESQPIFESRRRLADAVLERQREIRRLNDPGSLAGALRGLGTGALPSLWHRLRDVRVPTLLVAGELDAKFVSIAERMAHAMPSARMVVIPGVGHTAHLEAPAAWLDAVVGFLGRGPQGPGA